MTPCAGKSELFFSEDARSIAQARMLCYECRLMFRCLQGATERREVAGVWGGQFFQANSRHDFLRRAGAARSAA